MHLHQFDAIAVGILDPGLAVAVGAAFYRRGQLDALGLDLRAEVVEIVDQQAKVVDAVGVPSRSSAGRLACRHGERGAG